MSSEIAESVAAVIAARAEQRRIDYERRQTTQAEFRTERQEARRHGLIARHRAKLARIRAAEA